jgi:hypothetical protein
MNGVRDLQAWRWLFIIEGMPSCICAILVFFLYPDFPEVSRWLSVDERAIAVDRVRGVASLGHEKITWADAKATILDWRLYLHYSLCVSFSVAFSSISLFTPTIVSGLGYEGLAAQLFTVPPYAIAFVVTLIIAWKSDKHGLRCWAAFICFMVAGISFLIEGERPSFIMKLMSLICRTGALPANAFKARYAFLCVAVPFSFAINPPLLSWLTANLRSTGASTMAVPLNISFGEIGQLVGRLVGVVHYLC